MLLTLQQTLLQNTVHPIPELHAFKVQAEQLKAHTGKDLTYDQCYSLLLSAAQHHDHQNFSSLGMLPKQHIYEHFLDDNAYNDGEQKSDDADFDIDYPADTVDVNNTKVCFS